MERDGESGLSYHTARYYLPWLGRWGSCDPIGIADDLNVFLYAGNKPNDYFDKSGLQKKKLSESDKNSLLFMMEVLMLQV